MLSLNGQTGLLSTGEQHTSQSDLRVSRYVFIKLILTSGKYAINSPSIHCILLSIKSCIFWLYKTAIIWLHVLEIQKGSHIAVAMHATVNITAEIIHEKF